MKEKTIWTMKAVWKLFMTILYATFSFDSLMMSKLSDLAKRPFWKKFWWMDSKMEMVIAEGIRKLC